MSKQKLNNILFFYFIGLIPFIGLAQRTISLETKVSQSVHSKIYTETELGIGVNLALKKGSISFLMHYQYGGNWETKDLNYQKVKMYTLDYHLIGGEIKYRIFNLSNFYSPTLCVSLSKEIASSYRGGYLISHDWAGVSREYVFKPSNSSQTGGLTHPNKNLAYYYISTPLISSIMFGNEFRIMEGFYANLGIGMSIRSIRVGYKEWNNTQPEPDPILNANSTLLNSEKLKLLDLRVGFSYVFQFKSIPKAQ
ncbi:hypothetical protein [Brumimicrobium mesophilum]|uniref:hypothetical protein n=1 Tax=Brumimicrobium mesophilum TaxID=392717 RepID=UPI000D140FC0|nr:hypothetical protein [Brumimicrobium mesophilum]